MMDPIATPSRSRPIKEMQGKGKCVSYWMSRDQRVEDNPALAFAISKSDQLGLPVLSFFCLAPSFLGASIRHYDFMLEGLKEVEIGLRRKGVGFAVLLGDPVETVADLMAEADTSVLVTDFDPVRQKLVWKGEAIKQAKVSAFEVDAHNIIPCWIASGKREWSAATFRPKVKGLLPTYLTEPRPTRAPKRAWREQTPIDWKSVRASLQVEDLGPELDWIHPGSESAKQALHRFLSDRLSNYLQSRNDPSMEGQSDLSPYLHFGQLAPQRVAWQVWRMDASQPSKDAFLEELIVRRELSDNFCLHVPDYDALSGFPEWARVTLDQHRFDARDYVYSLSEFEAARTHDPLWNAAQVEMVKRGKMHGYMRMYWAKKILEWAETPEEALRIAIALNDRYELDGRDPNGYAGIAWSIGGVHDRPWPPHKVFGKVRYMSHSGARSKFDVDAYIAKWSKP